MADAIKTGKKPDGATFYWFRISAGRNPVTRKRIQVYKSFGKLKDAKTEYAKIMNAISEQRYVAKDGITVADYLDRWAHAHSRDLEATTAAKNRHLLRPVRELLGDRSVQSLTRADIDALADWMLTSGRRRVGKPGTALSARTVKDTLTLFQRACDDAIDERLMMINPVRKVKRPKQTKPDHDQWSDDEAARFEKMAAQDRLSPVITLQCLGLRPEEVCGLRWHHVNLIAMTLSIRAARTLADGQPVEKATKTPRGTRVLPLDDTLLRDLKAFKALQARESAAAGQAYDPAGNYVLCDELGKPFAPDKLRRVWYRLMRQAGVPKITPYTASRHAAGTYLDRVGVSPGVIAAWLGHTDASFTMKTYVHPRPEDLAAARDALAARRARKDDGER